MKNEAKHETAATKEQDEGCPTCGDPACVVLPRHRRALFDDPMVPTCSFCGKGWPCPDAPTTATACTCGGTGCDSGCDYVTACRLYLDIAETRYERGHRPCACSVVVVK